MPTEIVIYCNSPGLWPGGASSSGPDKLERALNDFLQAFGEVTWDGDEHRGLGWTVGLLLYDEANTGSWVERLVAFLQEWDVPNGTFLSFCILGNDGRAAIERRTVEVTGR